METPRTKYYHDPEYHQLVDTMIGCIHKCHYTPSELREAALLASILYEEQQLPKRVLIPPNVESAINTLSEWTDAEEKKP
ncbi:MAG: hypothetical protein BA864_05005 [Desulfuromonadales bacterium C00003093]|nr:MAG: hypothetical protein BA864_05005 [Desulfuromonadales bacterium C00003093]